MKVWITKFALTEGVKAREVELVRHEPGMVVDRTTDYPQTFHGEGRDWHRTQSAAVSAAEGKRFRRITCLKRQIKKLEVLQF